jgi:replication factor A1
MPEAFGLKGWYDKYKGDIRPKALTASGGRGDDVTKHLADAEAEAMAANAPLFFNTKATIVMMGRTQMYDACISGCKKKVVDMNNGVYRCEKCNKDSDKCETRLIQSALVSDCTSDMWVTLFHEEAEKLLGVGAEELKRMRDENPQEFEEVIGNLNFRSYNFRLKAAKDHYKEETRVRTSVNTAADIKWAEYGHSLVDKIKAMSAS